MDREPGVSVGGRLHVSVTAAPDRTSVAVSGEVDFQTSPKLQQVLSAAVASGCPCVDIDFSDVSFCDCTGLSALLAVARAARAEGTELRLCTVPHALARLLRLTQADSAFTIDQPGGR